MRADIDAFLAGIFWLILIYLVFTHYKGANTLLSTTFTGGNATIKNLQGR